MVEAPANSLAARGAPKKPGLPSLKCSAQERLQEFKQERHDAFAIEINSKNSMNEVDPTGKKFQPLPMGKSSTNFNRFSQNNNNNNNNVRSQPYTAPPSSSSSSRIAEVKMALKKNRNKS